MTGLGDRLREARTAKGFTLDDLQSITKIQKRYLSGIENEDYSMMPGAFYVRAFIKQYAEAVGLEADEMLALYKDSSPSMITEEETNQISSTTMTRKKGLTSNNRLNEMMPKVIVALFIIVIIVVFWFLKQNVASNKPPESFEQEQPPVTIQNKPDSNKGEAGKVEENPEEEPVEEPVEPEEPEKPEQVLAFEGASGETSTYGLTAAESFELEIRLTGGSWIGIRDNTGKEWMTPPEVYKAGDVFTYNVTATEFVRIRVGRPMSTEIYVNGELLEYGVTPQATVPQNIVIEYRKQ
ncbi:helix-turn-helix domain-containing protein [Sporosarcina sp. FSL K6-3457]|uniref:helix-turn-helix domain-containing protein n=1 Tax=Sporosarcina sp. FSL K6-3457 TaxID=2978204 RepID=UPI0030F55EB1